MITIAIDGPSGAGKSSVAKALAEKLNILHFNTGALYRAIGLFSIKYNIDYKNEKLFNKSLKNLNLKIDFKNNKQIVILDNENVNHLLYTSCIDDVCSAIAQYEKAREKVLEIQRFVSKKFSLVMEGRDITWHVLPNANYKFYITASPEIRANRRYKDAARLGNSANLNYEEVLQDIKIRDERDINRKLYPLKIIEDAIVINTDFLTAEEVVEDIIKKIKIERG